MKKSSLAVVINTVRRPQELKLALDTLNKQTRHAKEVFVIVGDNDRDSFYVARNHSAVTRSIMINGANLAHSRNLGLSIATSEFVAFLDDDARAEPNWINEICNGTQDERIGFGGGWVLNADGSWQSKILYTDAFGRNTEASVLESNSWINEKHPYNLQRPHGCNSFFRREAALEVNGFDETYSYGYEEVDLAFSLTQAGWNGISLPHARVHHFLSPGISRGENGIPTESYNYWLSRSYFASKWAAPVLPYSAIAQIISVEYAEWCSWLKTLLVLNQIEKTSYYQLVEEAGDGMADGYSRGLRLNQTNNKSITSNSETFPHHIKHPKTSDLRDFDDQSIVFVSTENYDIHPAGIGKLYGEWARGVSENKVVTHLILPSNTYSRSNFDAGLWTHELSPYVERLPNIKPDIDSSPIRVPPSYSNRTTGLRRFVDSITRTKSAASIVTPSWGSFSLSLRTIHPLIVSLNTNLYQINQIHNDFSQLNTWLANMEFESIRRADQVLAISESVAEATFSQIGEPKIWKVVYPGTKFYDGPTDVNINLCPKKHLLFIGRNEPRKGLDILFQSFLRNPKLQHELGIIVAGSDPFNRLKHGRRLLREGTCVHFYPNPTEKAKYSLIDNAFAVVIPSFFESFGFVAVEAMSRGAIVLASDVGGLSEIIENGKSGLLFEPGNPESLTYSINLILNLNNEDLNCIRKNAIKRSDFFSRENAANRLLAALI